MHATLMWGRNSNTSGQNFVQEKRGKSANTYETNPLKEFQLRQKNPYPNNKIKIWWRWLDAKSCNAPAIGKYLRCWLQDQSSETWKPLTWKAKRQCQDCWFIMPLWKTEFFGFQQISTSTPNFWFGKPNIQSLFMAITVVECYKGIFNYPYSCPHQLYSFIHTDLQVSPESWTDMLFPKSYIKKKFLTMNEL